MQIANYIFPLLLAHFLISACASKQKTVDVAEEVNLKEGANENLSLNQGEGGVIEAPNDEYANSNDGSGEDYDNGNNANSNYQGSNEENYDNPQETAGEELPPEGPAPEAQVQAPAEEEIPVESPQDFAKAAGDLIADNEAALAAASPEKIEEAATVVAEPVPPPAPIELPPVSPDQVLQIEFNKAKLKDVLQVFSSINKTQYVLPAEIASETVTLRVNNLTWQEAFDLILDSYALKAEAKKFNIVRVFR